jgi:hypothetical protein
VVVIGPMVDVVVEPEVVVVVVVMPEETVL